MTNATPYILDAIENEILRLDPDFRRTEHREGLNRGTEESGGRTVEKSRL